MHAYPILQSGFLGITDKGLKKGNETEPSFRDAVIFKVVRSPLAKYHFSPVVKDIFMKWCAEPELLRDYDFRERILQAAFSCFATNNFYKWIVLQSAEPAMSELHKTFITETLDYLLTGAQRKIHPTSWLRLIEADERVNSIKIDARSYFHQETAGNTCYANDSKLPTNLVDLLTRWVSKDDGFMDLLYTLTIIFGDRSARTAITKETT